MTFDVGSGAYDCQISNLDLNTVSCAILAQSCRFPATLCGVTVSESSVGIGVTADLSSASALCIHAPQASCAIWNSCYDCQNHRLLRGTLEGGSCGNTLFESACRGQISELVKADERTKRYPFINMCVFNELKRECDSRPADSVDICENTTISTLNGCQVRGFSMDCSNETIWSCSDVNLLLSPDDTQPPEPIRIEGRLE
ncbi:MAG: hypothetical protein IPJ69_00295 [Deltaproteobacteria bacterium]|nr:MAG: hypothetical protein IPJ69_00295 [Deltaproteobacteria bacterium]